MKMFGKNNDNIINANSLLNSEGEKNSDSVFSDLLLIDDSDDTDGNSPGQVHHQIISGNYIKSVCVYRCVKGAKAIPPAPTWGAGGAC